VLTVTRDLIEYAGIADCLPISPRNFTQMNVEDEMFLPIQKPDIEQIAKVTAQAIIKNKKFLKTPVGTSLEGFRLTGNKVLIEGVINYKIQYVGCTEYQSLHISNFSTPFISFIILPEDFCFSSNLTLSTFIEDIYVHTLDCRGIYINTTLLLTAEEC
jgi:hypothetical protein